MTQFLHHFLSYCHRILIKNSTKIGFGYQALEFYAQTKHPYSDAAFFVDIIGLDFIVQGCTGKVLIRIDKGKTGVGQLVDNTFDAIIKCMVSKRGYIIPHLTHQLKFELAAIEIEDRKSTRLYSSHV